MGAQDVAQTAWGCADDDEVIDLPFTCSGGPCTCPAFVNLCDSSRWGAQVRERCPATCGECTGPATQDPTPVPTPPAEQTAAPTPAPSQVQTLAPTPAPTQFLAPTSPPTRSPTQAPTSPDSSDVGLWGKFTHWVSDVWKKFTEWVSHIFD